MLFHYWKHLYVRKLMPLTKRLVFLSFVFSTLLGFPDIDAVAADSILSDRVDAVSGDPTASSSGTKVRLGLLDFEFESSYLSRVEDIQATVLKHLQVSTPGIVIEPRYYKTKDLAEAVRKGEVEFFSEVRASLLKCGLMAYEISERLFRRASPILISVLLV